MEGLCFLNQALGLRMLPEFPQEIASCVKSMRSIITLASTLLKGTIVDRICLKTVEYKLE